MSSELFTSLAYCLIGGFLIFLAITVTRDNLSNKLNRVTGGMFLCAGLGPIFVAMGTIMSSSSAASGNLEGSVLYGLHHLWEMFYPSLLLFSWIFPVDRLRKFRHQRLRYLIFVPQIMQVALLVFFGQITGIFEVLRLDPAAEGLLALILKPLSGLLEWLFYLISSLRNEHTAVFGAINLFYVGAAIYFLESGRKYLSNPRLLSQTRLVLWGTRLGLGLFVVAHLGTTVLPYEFPPAIKSTLMILALLVATGIFIAATIRYQFLDVRLILRQSFVYTVTSGLLVGAYVLIVIESKQILIGLFGEQAEVISYAFIIVILLLFQPINNWIDEIIRSMFIRTRTDHRNILQRFSRQVISQFDPKKLRVIIDDSLRTSLLVEKVLFVQFDDEVQEYAILPDEDQPRRVVIDRNDLMLRGINLLDAPAYFDSLSDFMEGSSLGERLGERGIKMILPMKDADHMLGFVGLTNKIAGYRYSSEDINLLSVLSNQMVSALTNARLYVESLERIRLQEEVNMARQIQLGLLPSKPPTVSTAAIYACSTPSRTVGGDFYDFIQVDKDRIGIVIADASGKGMPAALMIAQIQAIIRSEVNNGNRIETMMKNMNQQVVAASTSEKYVTLFYGELDTTTGRFYYANAGHNYPVLARANGEIEFLKEGGVVIGALPSMEYRSASVQLGSDDILFLFTDGLSEAMDQNDVEYSEERIHEFVCKHRHKCPDDLVASILSDMKEHDPIDPPRDDTTIIALKMNNNIQVLS